MNVEMNVFLFTDTSAVFCLLVTRVPVHWHELYLLTRSRVGPLKDIFINYLKNYWA